MRRAPLFLLLILFSTTWVLAQADATAQPEPLRLETEGKAVPGNMIDGGQWVPVKLEPAAPPATIDPASPEADAASDECSLAPELDLSTQAGDGGQTFTRFMTTAASDPNVLSCMFGAPSSPQGYRSVWYTFTAPTTGRVVIESRANPDYLDNYDTVIILHTGTCAALTQLVCNDDYNGFLSRTSGFVVRDQTYYVEVVDWQFGVNFDAILNLVAWIEAPETVWSDDDQVTMPELRSRHGAVAVGNQLYVIAGQTVVNNNPVRTGRMDRYDTVTGQWTQLASMPGPDSFGYSNGDAAVVNNKIYLPAGYIGLNDQYDGTHWVYDIPTNSWSTTVSAPFPFEPSAYYTVVEVPAQQGYYLIGGLNGAPLDPASPAQNTMLFFRQGSGVIADTWFNVFNPLTTPRYYHVAAMLTEPNGWICVVGGLTTGNIFPTQGECFNSSGDWIPIARLNIQRFGAESVIGPDGRWYVFGGYDSSLNLVPEVEVFTPPNPGIPSDLGSWAVLDPPYNLNAPARAWPRGDVVGNRIWLTGGETYIDPNNTGAGVVALPIMNSLFIVPEFPRQAILPLVFADHQMGEPNDTLSNAAYIPLNTPFFSNFESSQDFYDVFFFDALAAGNLNVTLSNIPSGADYDLYLYDANKLLVQFSRNLGNLDEQIQHSGLPPGQYYLVVVRALPITAPPPQTNYRLFVGFQ
ncbi:MAG: pre-peptidase C-terminal domain-containing protein [Ardenticatenales bacterium]|nr:pre-peptidase C-terminal domain-containing protein [Ardenticatenales bacterium]